MKFYLGGRIDSYRRVDIELVGFLSDVNDGPGNDVPTLEHDYRCSKSTDERRSGICVSR